MKVVLFCGGQGLRIRAYAENLPKPMVEIGNRPVLWNLMNYYAHYGHKEFILCLGFRADVIKNYFLQYNECLNNDFILSKGGADVQLLNRDIDDWKITFVDTGLTASIGERLRAVRSHIGDDEVFMANYADGLTDLPLDEYLVEFSRHGKTAQLLSVQAPAAFHILGTDDDNCITRIEHVGESKVRVNGGFFVFRREIFDVMQEGEDLVEEPFQRLMSTRQIIAYPYDGFWQNMDTFKDKQRFDDYLQAGRAPWQVWS